MKIRNRLRISYILMLLVPVVLIMLTGMMFRDHYEKGFDTIELPEVFLSEVYSTMLNNPDILLTASFLKELGALSGWDAVNITVYQDHSAAAEFSPALKHSGPGHFASSWNFYFSDGSPGRLSVFVHDKSMMKGLFTQSGLFVLLVIAVLLLTNGVLSYLVAGSIIKPLNALENSAIRIKNEDLDSPLVYTGTDEFQDVFTAFEDMRARLKNSLTEQLKAEENRKELLSSISHDLKTPITTIKGYIEGIRDGVADSPLKVEKYIDTVYSKAILMNELIDSLFLFSKLDLNRVHFNFHKINLSMFFNDICEEMRFDYPDIEIKLNVENGAEVKADGIHLHRVVTNLIDNAVKYRSDKKPCVEIIVSIDGEFAVISVQDNGRGIAEEDLPRVFEHFHRADPSRSPEVEGSGLGLSISKQIIAAHGGIIKAQSSVGKGTMISFTLRLSE